MGKLMGKLMGTALLAAGMLASAAATGVTDAGDGEIRKVDATARRVIISHGDWQGGNMSAMTMAMPVREGVDLGGLRRGDRVRFEVERDGRDWVVTRVARQVP